MHRDMILISEKDKVIIDHILSFFMKGHVSSNCGLTKYHTQKSCKHNE